MKRRKSNQRRALRRLKIDSASAARGMYVCHGGPECGCGGSSAGSPLAGWRAGAAASPRTLEEDAGHTWAPDR